MPGDYGADDMPRGRTGISGGNCPGSDHENRMQTAGKRKQTDQPLFTTGVSTMDTCQIVTAIFFHFDPKFQNLIFITLM
jgi:hypothetical protein